jgi:hypothetical protein
MKIVQKVLNNHSIVLGWEPWILGLIDLNDLFIAGVVVLTGLP